MKRFLMVAVLMLSASLSASQASAGIRKAAMANGWYMVYQNLACNRYAWGPRQHLHGVGSNFARAVPDRYHGQWVTFYYYKDGKCKKDSALIQSWLLKKETRRGRACQGNAGRGNACWAYRKKIKVSGTLIGGVDNTYSYAFVYEPK